MQIPDTYIEEAIVKDSREGFHQFERPCYQCLGEDSDSCDVCEGEGVNRSGSFEVFWNQSELEGDFQPGWYWWPSFPGCLPDGDPIGPFSGSIAAYYDAQENQ